MSTNVLSITLLDLIHEGPLEPFFKGLIDLATSPTHQTQEKCVEVCRQFWHGVDQISKIFRDNLERGKHHLEKLIQMLTAERITLIMKARPQLHCSFQQETYELLEKHCTY